ncbi:DUF885 domain-containing protein [Ferrimonas lipolytica]|uniref:DUF885 domain-containing protein n=1 Tax=Ferrimonas lipolytica TaxID=2724191 RepID=A0A6H1UBY6_9GAMM|nr:DUF885 domain-containing protein [Ferrimonas lipolytica]QIZ75716.1 DUF885 domain-containing protein [Ferrimonas lipolytica]
MKKLSVAIALALSSASLAGFASDTLSPTASQIAANTAVNNAVIQTESERADQLFEQIFMENVMASPVFQSYLGIKKDQDKWDDLSLEADDKKLQRTKKHLELLLQLDETKLEGQTRISYQLMKQSLEHTIEDDKWRYYNYPVTQMYGYQSGTPSFLINQHAIGNVTDANAYISRLKGIKQRFEQGITQLKKRESLGIMAPKFTFAYAISDSNNVISGAPFDAGEDSPLWADFKTKVGNLEIDPATKAQLLAEAEQALKSQVKSGYQQLITFLEGQAERADTKDGAWKLPKGDEYYQVKLQRTTTTNLNAQQIHQLGLDEVARIHDEMRAIMKKVGFDGSLQQFFEFMRTDKQFYLDSDQEGRDQYLSEATAIIEDMESRLDESFNIKPKARLTVKRVEPFREVSAGKAFYQQPAPDGSRPGIYYANLYDMADMPTYQMEALAFHEGIPGHHMQIAIAQELPELPKFRRFGSYTAYIEGWGLYSEYLPKEMGYYQDPYSDFGRLAMELWRACRLVVDTGIHANKWSREQAIDYLATNTPNAQGDVVKAIERYIVMPSQATAYKIGMNKILNLRQLAKQQLGDKFTLPDFHDAILANGPVPLDIMEQQVNQYVQTRL